MITEDQAEISRYILKIYELEQKQLKELQERQRLSDLRRKQLSCNHKGYKKFTRERESDYRTYDYWYMYCNECKAYLAEVMTRHGIKLIISDYELVKDYIKRGFPVLDTGDRV